MKNLFFLALASALLLPALVAAEPDPRPNIIVILADDMGFSDIGCYGGEIETPNIDALAAKGLRFTNFYNTSRCCPTRASLLTGLYPAQAGVGEMEKNEGPKFPGYQGALNDRCITIAEALKPAGYFTAMSGKWHVGSKFHQRPSQRGFDRFYGVPEGGGFYFKLKPGRSVTLDNELIYSPEKQPPAGWYATDAFTDHAIQFIGEAKEHNKPFFLYLAHIAPHFPLQAPEADIAKYRGKYLAGWDELRKKRFERQQLLGITDESWSLPERDPQVAAWADMGDEQKRKLDERMAIYAACMGRMDQGIGRIMDSLKKSGQFENTLILFLSDNGGTPEGGNYGKTEGPGTPGSADSNVYSGRAWASLQNTPFRLYKSFAHEGGISTPLVAHWPAGIKQPGTVTRATGHVIDLMPTFLDLAGATYPEEFQGKQIPPLEGRSLTPVLAGGTRPEPQSLFWEHEGKRAVRQGNWKLVALTEGSWELYDLSKDRSESHNLAPNHPDQVASLSQLWNQWAIRTMVLPSPKHHRLPQALEYPPDG